MKRIFVSAMRFFGCNLSSVNSLECISMNNQECKARPETLNVNSKEPVSRTNETSHIEWHETCKCKCRLDASVCNNKQCWNEDKCRCNPSNCECECEKSCDTGKYLDYENCKCRKKLVDRMVEECTENVEKVKLAKITLAENENKCK